MEPRNSGLAPTKKEKVKKKVILNKFSSKHCNTENLEVKLSKNEVLNT